MIGRVVFTLLSVLIILFIFGNSLLDASASTVQSTGVREFINSILGNWGFKFEFSENFVRKCAHFVEYFTLSISLFLMFLSYLRKTKITVIATLLTGFLTACIDETIQLFSAGRSAQISDVMLDFSAVMIAAFVLYIIVMKFKKRGKTYNG